MRLASAAMARRAAAPARQLPSPGTRLRLVYDTLYECRGRPVDPGDWQALDELTRRAGGACSLGHSLTELTDYWGCDIRRPAKYSRTPPALVGEWVGRVYLDYTAPATERA